MIEYELRLICKHDSRTVEGCVTCEAADEIERLRARLEIDPAHPYDGIATRDETIRMQESEIERLRAEVEALRKALDELVSACELPGWHCEVEQALPAAISAIDAARGEKHG